jgi:L-fuconolactonase
MHTMHPDTHRHFWIYNQDESDWIDESMAALRRNFLPGDLGPELNRSGFAGSVTVQERQSLEETGWLPELGCDVGTGTYLKQ